MKNISIVRCWLAMAAILFALAFSAAAIPPLSDQEIEKAVQEAYFSQRSVREGKNADYIPYLAKVPSNLFGITVVTVDGKIFSIGDTDYPFAIESVSKPFTLSLVMQQQGEVAIPEKIGVEPTGLPFNSVLAIELRKERSINPLVNAGAIAAVSLVQANGAEDRWHKIMDHYGRFAGEKLTLNEEVYRSESETNRRNRSIAELLYSYGRLYCAPPEAVDVYTKQCSVNVTAKQLAVMGATLANSGINPFTKERCLNAEYVPKLLAVMTIAGFYDDSGRWAWESGLPAKTGVGGGIVAIVPGKMAIAAFSPPLDEFGNSVRAAGAIKEIGRRLELNIFQSSKDQ